MLGSLMGLSYLVLLVPTVPLATAAVVLFVEIAVATSLRPKMRDVSGERPPVVVLIPAHNESRGILPTLADARPQLHHNDQLLVVADNCTDDTADIAKAAGAQVIERNDPERLGKGYALDFGFRSLHDGDPEIIIVIDADCRLEETAIDQLARTCWLSGRPVQALYVMNAPEKTSLNYSIAVFAWRVKNDLRAQGLTALGLPCQLMGSGMAFFRKDLAGIELATAHLTEDLDLGLKLAANGHAPLFCPTAVVKSVFPSTEQAATAQRTRWEHGHLSILAGKLIPYGWRAVRDRNWHLLALSLDAAVPPLVLFALLIAVSLVASSIGWVAGAGAAPLIVSAIALVLLGSSLCLAWISCGRDLLPVTTLASMIPYIASKLRIYAGAFASNKKWVRTARRKPD